MFKNNTALRFVVSAQINTSWYTIHILIQSGFTNPLQKCSHRSSKYTFKYNVLAGKQPHLDFHFSHVLKLLNEAAPITSDRLYTFCSLHSKENLKLKKKKGKKPRLRINGDDFTSTASD